MRRHEGHEGYEYGNRPHENEGTPQLLAAEVSMGKLAATTLKQTGRQFGRKTHTGGQEAGGPSAYWSCDLRLCCTTTEKVDLP